MHGRFSPVLCALGIVLFGTINVSGVRAEADPLVISARHARTWSTKTADYALIRGACVVQQGRRVLKARQMLVRRRGPTAPDTVTVYADGDVRETGIGFDRQEPTVLTVFSAKALKLTAGRREQAKGEDDPLFKKALAEFSLVDDTEKSGPKLPLPPAPDGPQLQPLEVDKPNGNFRRLRINQRSSVPYNVLSFESTRTTPPEQIIVLSGGVNIVIEGLKTPEIAKQLQRAGVKELGTIDLSADRVVIWTQSFGSEFRSEALQPKDAPLQVYLEGNIRIRQGGNVVKAERAFYDAQQEQALILNAELRAQIPGKDSFVRVRAERLKAVSSERFIARNAWVSTSPFGKPGYRFQSREILLEPRNPEFFFGARPIDPKTGRPTTVPYLIAKGNTMYIDDVPVMSVPTISGPAEDPNIPLRKITGRADGVMGVSLETRWDLMQILGVDLPGKVRWDLLADYRSKRGPSIGTVGDYLIPNLMGLSDRSRGEFDLRYQYDQGRDNLGFDRRNLLPETDNRGRAKVRHRSDIPGGFTFIGEFGILSDRNYLEQFHEAEFDTGKDQESLLFLKQEKGNIAWSLLGRAHLNDFENQTAWLPRADFLFLSEPLLGGAFTYSSRSSAGYARMRQSTAPTDPAETYTPIPYHGDAAGGVFMTRHEIDAPFNLGPLKLAPYAWGEAAYWQSDLTGNEIERFVGSVGLRGSLSFWKIYPYINSKILGLNGLAHKMDLVFDYSYTRSSMPLGAVPQYNEIDDNSQERFRERLVMNTFGLAALPTMLNPRFFALRRGAGAFVSVPYHELVDDLHVARLQLRQRLQTKTGPPGHRRIRDWMIFDVGLALFPDPDRDNFGEVVGLLEGHYRWNFSDRTSLIANALYDVFDGGAELWDAGFLTQRGERGSFYIGVRQIKAGTALDSLLLTASASYAMSEKWIATLGTAVDLNEGTNRGQSATISYIGADFLIHLGANYDASRDNFGFAISVEPRLGPRSVGTPQFGRLLEFRDAQGRRQ